MIPHNSFRCFSRTFLLFSNDSILSVVNFGMNRLGFSRRYRLDWFFRHARYLIDILIFIWVSVQFLLAQATVHLTCQLTWFMDEKNHKAGSLFVCWALSGIITFFWIYLCVKNLAWWNRMISNDIATAFIRLAHSCWLTAIPPSFLLSIDVVLVVQTPVPSSSPYSEFWQSCTNWMPNSISPWIRLHINSLNSIARCIIQLICFLLSFHHLFYQMRFMLKKSWLHQCAPSHYWLPKFPHKWPPSVIRL